MRKLEQFRYHSLIAIYNYWQICPNFHIKNQRIRKASSCVIKQEYVRSPDLAKQIKSFHDSRIVFNIPWWQFNPGEAVIELRVPPNENLIVKKKIKYFLRTLNAIIMCLHQ